MNVLAITIGAVAVAAWVYLLVGRGWFWREADRGEYQPRRADRMAGPKIVAVMPARNEAATIGRAVRSLLEQDYDGDVHIMVVDDQSDDGTAEAARAAAQGNPHLEVMKGKPLPAGWAGKVWAMQQGIEAARASNPAFILLTDADVVHAPDNLAKLVEIAIAGGYDLTSFMVRLHCESTAERLLIPVFVFFFFLLYPPRWVADPRKQAAGAAGGCMLVRPEALKRARGMASIRGEVIDDCALARMIKNMGGRAWLGLNTETVSVRAYGSFGEIGRMISRTAFNQLQHSALMLAGAMAAMLIAFVAPLALLFSGGALPAGLGAVSWALMTLAYAPMVRFYGIHLWWAATLPAAACFYMGAALWSAVKFWTGRGGEWKGRAQDPN